MYRYDTITQWYKSIVAFSDTTEEWSPNLATGGALICSVLMR